MGVGRSFLLDIGHGMAVDDRRLYRRMESAGE